MKPITKEMVKIYKMKKLGYDFMGYKIHRLESLSFHHLIVPHRECKKRGLGEGYVMWNGAILNQSTSHDYLHIIEQIDYDSFLAITSEMIDENIKGYLDIENLQKIREILIAFEEKHINDTNKKGKRLIRRQFIEDRFDF